MRRLCPLILAAALGRAGAGELMRLVSEPTAGVVAKRTYYVGMGTFPDNGVTFALSLGLTRGLMVGASYGAWNLTGTGETDWFDHVTLLARFRFIGETEGFPGLAAGYDGREEPTRAGGAYSRHDRGFYLVASKNFAMPPGDLGLHGGISLSPEHSDHAGLFLGMDKSLPAGFGLAADWDLATAEADSVRFDEAGGFVNLEAYWESFGQVRISLQLKDILETGGESYRALAVDFLGLL
jgi:hypothetical protein